ncbi:MAG: hypothetical protein NTX01_01135 [Candidatus Omnitrophica bacterium]|nr:hypothetical protein [Candidatus Omnitrophota bacterium]
MGVIHKLKPEVLSFIIENKQNNPVVSCRYLTSLILEQLQIKVSKSSINAIFKENNLSMPIGRRRKLKKKKFNLPVLEEPSLEEKRVKEAEEWAIKLQEEERIRVEEKLSLEKQKLKAEDEAGKRVLEEARKLEEEKAAQEAELRVEREKWARLAEAEQNSKQQANKEEALLPKVEFAAPEILPEDRVCSGAIILKALDCLIGGSKEINAAASRAIGGRPEDSLNLTEALIFKSLFGKDNSSTLEDLIGARYSQEKLSNYYARIKQVTGIELDTAKIISNVFTEAKGVKAHFIDGSVIHLDGQLYSSWPAERFPCDFSNTVYGLKNNLNKYFLQGQPLVLFSPAGYDILPKDFFNLLLNIGSKDNYLDSLTLFGNKSEELENIPLNHEHRRVLVFGLWPWQFTLSRKVKKIGDFYLKQIKEIGRDLYLAEIEIDLFRASLNQSVTLKGCAVKTNLEEKIRLVILNSGERAMGLEELAGIYLSRWPNFEEAFQDFSRKIELFTYAGSEQKFLSQDRFKIDTEGLNLELGDIFVNYINMLDLYLRWHFLPTEYTEKDFSSTSECFYKLPVKLMASQSRVKAVMMVSRDYQFLKDLEYLNCRLNERQINAANGKRLWFENAFK